jgi:hypothetical protein
LIKVGEAFLQCPPGILSNYYPHGSFDGAAKAGVTGTCKPMASKYIVNSTYEKRIARIERIGKVTYQNFTNLQTSYRKSSA